MMTFTDFLEAFCRMAAIADMPSITQVERVTQKLLQSTWPSSYECQKRDLAQKLKPARQGCGAVGADKCDGTRQRVNHDASVSGYMRREEWQ